MKIKRVHIDDEARGVLTCNVSYDGNSLKITRMLERSEYENVNSVLKALGGKWNRKAGTHDFPSDAKTLITEALSDGHVVDQAKTLEQFYTPPELARVLVGMAGVARGDVVLEPSAGRGAIVAEMQRYAPGASILCIVIDPKNCDHLRTMEGLVVYPGDFLKADPDKLGYTSKTPYDKIVMNPPFTDAIEHVRHAFSMLKPGGILVTVMPNSVEFRTDKKFSEFRAFVLSCQGEITKLPEGAFKESGTGVNSCIVKMVKPKVEKKKKTPAKSKSR